MEIPLPHAGDLETLQQVSEGEEVAGVAAVGFGAFLRFIERA